MLSVNQLCKRTLDIFLAAAGLVIAAPVMLVIALLVWLDDPGVIIFSQTRLGKEGKRFRVHKFRKFRINWDDNSGSAVTVRGDVRMTKIGRVLERTKLDELPQLWNIFKGEMSFVGPRPESLRYEDLFIDPYRQVLDYIPGIFGPNQIAYRNEADMYPADESPDSFYRRVLFPAKAKNDIAYFSRANCLKDMEWIIKGLWVSVIGAVPWRRFLGLHARIMVSDALMISIGWLASYTLRYHDFVTTPSGLEKMLSATSSFRWHEAVDGLIIFPPLIITTMILCGCYRTPVRHFSVSDAIRLVWIVSISWMLGFLLLIGLAERGISILLFPLGGASVLALLFLPRIMARRINFVRNRDKSSHRRRVVVYGTDVAGISLARWLQTGQSEIQLVGYVDDDLEKNGQHIADSSVLGRESDLPTIREVHDITEVWVTFCPDRIKRRRLNTSCAELGISVYYIADLNPFAGSSSVSEAVDSASERKKENIPIRVTSPVHSSK